MVFLQERVVVSLQEPVTILQTGDLVLELAVELDRHHPWIILHPEHCHRPHLKLH